ADPATRAYEIQELSVDNGHVILTGRVDSYRERTLVAQVVKSVDGVRGIDNRVEVSPKLVRSDDELKAEIETTLEWDLFVDDGLIEVEVEDGVVSLTGTVGSAAEKWRATTTAWVTGVKEVDASGLNVERWARDEDLRRRKYAARSDEEIRAAVEDALARDPRVLAFPLSVYVDGGNVTLRGIVDNLRARHAAEQDARNTVGILRVSNRIKVRVTPGLNDEDIRSDVVQAFIRDSVVESYEIDVRVVGGKVTLSGQTDSYFEKFHADDVVSGVEGVVSVENRIVVDHDRPRTVYDPYVEPESFPDGYGEYYYEGPSSTDLRPDAEIAEEVKDELWWSPFVDSDHIDVSVDDGVVTLRGTVDSWAEARTAIENAYEGGARRVTNELTVSPSSS
ncbi:MAG TPA: BON domain-containing protein, partial [Vicinamibacteria bacterium]|nr:BON domain-containing protein [Vicinamibacteria bacterium]